MSRVEISLNGRPYAVHCEPGQEARVRELSDFVDQRLREIAMSGSTGSDAHLLMLTTLVLADQLFDLQNEVAALRASIAAAAAQPAPEPEVDESVLAAVDDLAKRLEDIAARLEDA